MKWTMSSVRVFVIKLVIISTLVAVSKQQDPCSLEEHTILEDAEGLYSAGAATPGNKFTCQRLIREGWYRVRSPAGEDMPTQCVDIAHCRTRFPIWLKGTLPGVGQMKTVQAVVTTKPCAAMAVPAVKFPIKVKNCGAFRVYYLVRPAFCPVAYCFGKETRCPPGTGSSTGFSPGCARVSVTFTADVSIKVKPVMVNTEHQIEFECSLANMKLHINPAQGVHYDVEWYIWKSGVSQRVLQETKDLPLTASQAILPAGLNIDVSCRVRARGKLSGAPSPFIESNKFFVGVKSEPNGVLVFKNAGIGHQVKFTATVPFLCSSAFQCELTFEIVITNNKKRVCRNNPPLLGTAQPNCKTSIAGILPGNPAVTQSTIFTVESSANDVTTHGTYTMKLYLRTQEFNFDHSIWANYAAPPLTVTVSDELPAAAQKVKLTSAVCYANNDPHMRTFDGCYYENQVGAEFILYRHKVLPYQVNIFTSACGRTAFCTQGVAIMSGRTHYIWDKKPFPGSSGRDTYLDCDENDLQFRVNGNTKIITFKTGTRVEIVGFKNTFANVRVIPSIQDIGLTEGLCQMLDGVKETQLVGRDDVKTPCSTRMNPGLRAFALSWSVKPADSLYNQNPTLYQAVPDHPGIGLCDCSCNGMTTCDKAECDNSKWTTECSPLGNNVNNVHKEQCRRIIFNRRRKRAAGELPGDDFTDNSRPAFQPEEPDFPRPKPVPDWNEEKAREHCENSILRSKAGQICTKIENVQYKDTIENCIKDIMLTDTDDFLQDAVDSMKLSCQNEVRRNFDLWEKTPGSNVPAPPVEVLNEICPGSCSGHGTCLSGECHCHDGYGSEDCSVSLTQPPYIKANMECDLSARPCKKVSITGKYFINSDQLKCRIDTFTIQQRGTRKQHHSMYPGEFLNQEEIMCPLPDVEMLPGVYGALYTIRVANNGRNFGNAARVVAYNKKCVVCKKFRCSRKPGHCFLEGMCYQDGATNPKNPQLKCDSLRNVGSERDREREREDEREREEREREDEREREGERGRTSRNN